MDAAGQQAWAASAIDRRSGFFVEFAALAKELGINIAVTYLEAYLPKPRNSVSIIDCDGDVALNYSKVLFVILGTRRCECLTQILRRLDVTSIAARETRSTFAYSQAHRIRLQWAP